MAGRLRLNTNVTQHEYDAVTPTQNKPGHMQYALLDAIALVPRTASREQDFACHNSSINQQQHLHQPQPYIPQQSSTSMFESLAAAAPPAIPHPISAPAPYPLAIAQHHQFAGERDATAYTSYAASDMDTYSAGPSTPASCDWSPASLSYQSSNGLAYGQHMVEQVSNAPMDLGHLYGSIYNPGYVNINSNFTAFAQALSIPVQHVLPQSEPFQHQQHQRYPAPELPNLAFAELGASLPAVPTSATSSPETNALYYSSGEESSRTSLSRASSIASIASSTGSRSGKSRASSKLADGTAQSGDKREKRFTCSYPGCDRSFSRNFNLSTHYNTHLGIKPFACTHCDKTFSRRHDCARHIAAVHTPACTKTHNASDCNCGHGHDYEHSHEPPSTPGASASSVDIPSLPFAQMSPFTASYGVFPNLQQGT